MSNINAKSINVGRLNVTENVMYHQGRPFDFTSGGGGGQWITSGSSIYYDTGNVGIGTNNPQAKLDVSGNVKAAAFKGNLEDATHVWTRNVRVGSNTSGNCAELGGPPNGFGYLDLSENGAVQIRLDASGNSYFLANNVGIGTSSPSAKLEVAGNITTSGNVEIGTGHGIKMNLMDASGETFLSGSGASGTCTANGYCGKIKLNGTINSGSSAGFDWTNNKLQDDSAVFLQLSCVKNSLGDSFDSTIVKYQKATSPGTARTVVLTNSTTSTVDFSSGLFFVNYFIVNQT